MPPTRIVNDKQRALASQPAAAALARDEAGASGPAPVLEGEPAVRCAGAPRTRLEQMLLVARQMRQH
jgi:hypothetical protein